MTSQHNISIQIYIIRAFLFLRTIIMMIAPLTYVRKVLNLIFQQLKSTMSGITPMLMKFEETSEFYQIYIGEMETVIIIIIGKI